MGFPFKLKKLDIDESYPQSLSPIQVALFLSEKKANHYLIKNNEILIPTFADGSLTLSSTP